MTVRTKPWGKAAVAAAAAVAVAAAAAVVYEPLEL